MEEKQLKSEIREFMCMKDLSTIASEGYARDAANELKQFVKTLDKQDVNFISDYTKKKKVDEILFGGLLTVMGGLAGAIFDSQTGINVPYATAIGVFAGLLAGIKRLGRGFDYERLGNAIFYGYNKINKRE